MLLAEERCRACLRCHHLNPYDATSCEFGCGFLASKVYPITQIAQVDCVTICPSCGTLYSQAARVCKKCHNLLKFGSEAFEIAGDTRSRICDTCKSVFLPLDRFCSGCGAMRKHRFCYDKQPILPIMLIHNGAQVRCGGLVDTGAECTVFPLKISRMLNITLNPDDTMLFDGVASNAPITGYKALLQISLGFHRQYETSVYFSSNVSLPHVGLLGNNNFLDLFDIEYKGRKRIITIRERTHLLQEARHLG
jgi:hypothetical protein